MKKIHLWACTANTDTIEGKGANYDVCYAETKDIATEIVNSPGFYGRFGVIGCHPYKKREFGVHYRTIVILETPDELKDLVAEQKRQAALAKLTEEDRRVLGLL
jgi:hypothetical protein